MEEQRIQDLKDSKVILIFANKENIERTRRWRRLRVSIGKFIAKCGTENILFPRPTHPCLKAYYLVSIKNVREGEVIKLETRFILGLSHNFCHEFVSSAISSSEVLGQHHES